MAKTHKEKILGVEYTFQSVSPTWYYETNDDCGMTSGGKRKTAQYMDTMFKNVVVSPAEVRTQGMAYFDELDDIETPEKLIGAIEKFLRGRKQSATGTKTGPQE